MAFTYRPDDKTQKNIDEIKKRKGIAANSKAIDYAVNRNLDLEDLVNTQEKTISKLRDELYQIKTTIKRKIQADNEFNQLIDNL